MAKTTNWANAPRTIHFILILVIALLAGSGCGGAGGSRTSQFGAAVDFGNTQTGMLNVHVDGETVSGTLVCNDPPAQGPGSFIPAGAYDLTGTFDPPNSFSLSGSLPEPIGVFTVSGTLPTGDQPGSYTLTIAGINYHGQIARQTPVVTVDPDRIPMTQGDARVFTANVSHAPSGTLVYRWFIAAPAAYLDELIEPHRQGQDIETTDHQIKVQSGPADHGHITLYCHAYSVAPDNMRTFVGEGKATLEFEDIQVLTVNWVHEVASGASTGGLDVHAYFWEFPVVPGAKDYVVTMKSGNGQTTQVYRLLQGDVENTPVTEIPYLTGNDPFPPTIPVHDELSGVVRHNFIRRGNAIRLLIVWGDDFDPEIYRNANPTSVVVRY